MTPIRLSEREAAALAALGERNDPTTGDGLARKMRVAGRPTSVAAAHQAGAALARKGLAIKGQRGVHDHAAVLYEINNAGRNWLAEAGKTFTGGETTP